MASVDLQQFWEDKLHRYAGKTWAEQPSLFANEALPYFPKTGSLLELGAGLGYDGALFAEHGLQVTQTDFVLSDAMAATHVMLRQLVDMAEPLPFEAASFDVVYAHLSLHYFYAERTEKLFEEIFAILKPGGVFAFLVNSTDDPELGEGSKLEDNYHEVEGTPKRFFDLPLTTRLTTEYDTLLFDNDGTSYKDREKGLVHLIRFVGRKLH